MPALGAAPHGTATYTDATGERTSFTVPVDGINPISLETIQSEWGDLLDAVDAIVLGERYKNALVDETVDSNDLGGGSRELKLLIQWRDSVTQQAYSTEIGTINQALLNFVPGGGDAVIFEGAGASATTLALVTAFEAVVQTKAGNSAEIYGMRLVGRNT